MRSGKTTDPNVGRGIGASCQSATGNIRRLDIVVFVMSAWSSSRWRSRDFRTTAASGHSDQFLVHQLFGERIDGLVGHRVYLLSGKSFVRPRPGRCCEAAASETRGWAILCNDSLPPLAAAIPILRLGRCERRSIVIARCLVDAGSNHRADGDLATAARALLVVRLRPCSTLATPCRSIGSSARISAVRAGTVAFCRHAPGRRSRTRDSTCSRLPGSAGAPVRPAAGPCPDAPRSDPRSGRQRRRLGLTCARSTGVEARTASRMPFDASTRETTPARTRRWRAAAHRARERCGTQQC